MRANSGPGCPCLGGPWMQMSLLAWQATLLQGSHASYLVQQTTLNGAYLLKCIGYCKTTVLLRFYHSGAKEEM